MAGPVSSINWGTSLPNMVDVYLVPGGQDATYTHKGQTYTITSSGWNAYEAQQLDLALTQVSNVANVQFNYVMSQAGAEMVMVTINDPDIYFAGLMVPPGEVFAGLAAFNNNGIGWDQFSPGTGALEQGGDAFKTILHELGHGLGLAHPHDNGGSSTVMKGVSAPFFDYGKAGLNQGIYTVMSYNSGWHKNPNGPPMPLGTTYGVEGTMMALDIASLQRKYGANQNFATGDDVYTLPSSNGTGTFYSCIWDAGGIDEICADPSTASRIDLRPATLKYESGGAGFLSHSFGINGGFTIAKNVLIENATGSQFNDTIIGNNASNLLDGLGGNDRINGNGGADTIVGGDGNDVLKGGKGNDDIYLGAGSDRAIGAKGRDEFFLGTFDPSDFVNGGKGLDRVHFDLDDNDHIVVFRRDKLKVDGQTFGKNFEAINVQGGNGNDIIKGGDRADVLSGGGGNDRLVGGRGNDTLTGGLGDDLLVGKAGADVFEFAALAGTDTVLDFTSADTAVFSTADLTDFADFQATAAEIGGDTVLALASGTVVFSGLSISDFSADQFDFV